MPSNMPEGPSPESSGHPSQKESLSPDTKSNFFGIALMVVGAIMLVGSGSCTFFLSDVLLNQDTWSVTLFLILLLGAPAIILSVSLFRKARNMMHEGRKKIYGFGSMLTIAIGVTLVGAGAVILLMVWVYWNPSDLALYNLLAMLFASPAIFIGGLLLLTVAKD